MEKPVDITVEAAIFIEEACIRMEMKAGVIYQNRNNAVMKPIKEAVDAGRLGKMVLANFVKNGLVMPIITLAGTAHGIWLWRIEKLRYFQPML